MAHEHDQDIQALIAILNAQHLTELEVERDGLRIRVTRASPTASPAVHLSSPPPTHVAATAPDTLAATTEADASLVTVTSPMVGTFYRPPSPDAPAYVDVGDVVRKGQTLCVIEAMKLMNEVESDVDGRIVKVLVDSGTGIEYGQPLFLIEPLDAA